MIVGAFFSGMVIGAAICMMIVVAILGRNDNDPER